MTASSRQKVWVCSMWLLVIFCLPAAARKFDSLAMTPPCVYL